MPIRRIVALLALAAPLFVALAAQAPGRPGGAPQIVTGRGRGVLTGSRRQIVQQLARENDDPSFATLLGALYDADRWVRREAANALVQRLVPIGFGLQVAKVREVLEARLRIEPDDADAARMMLRALGELPYDVETARSVERFLVEEAGVHFPDRPIRRLGAAEGLEALIRQGILPGIAAATRSRLEELAVPSIRFAAPPEPFLPALQALQAAGENSGAVVAAAARYRCKGATSPLCGWQYRRIAAQMFDAADESYSEMLKGLLRDPSAHVRLEAIRAVAARVAVQNDCQAIVDAFTDDAPIVAAEAMSLIDPRCVGQEDIVALLKPVADDLLDPEKREIWFLPVRAFSALARLSPEEGKRLLPDAARHPEWPVRDAAAHAAAVLGDAPIAVALSADPEVKVRTAAITTLMRLNSEPLPAVARQEIDRLRVRGEGIKMPDPGSLWIAATALEDRVRIEDFQSLFDVLRLPETARIARLAALDRIAELAKPDEFGISPLRLQAAAFDRVFKSESDRVVEIRVADVIEIIGGKRPALRPVIRPPRPLGPSASRVLVTMAKGDVIVIDLSPDEAPGTVTRFVTRLMRAGDGYRGSVFHRLLPNALIQGGSRSGSDWSAPECGAPADISGAALRFDGGCMFWRDEFNPLRHERGAVALATNGPDTGIGQFFVNLVDLPSFNHKYTVFGYVTCAKPARTMPFTSNDPVDLIDQFTEGEEITRIEVPPTKLALDSFICKPE